MVLGALGLLSVHSSPKRKSGISTAMSMSKPLDQPSSTCPPSEDAPSPGVDTTSGDLSGGTSLPPRPQIPPGHASPVRTPHAHDVLSGRGGRINSHPGNVRFRDRVDTYKREYLDPRTKKVEKARIAARIVSSVRSLEPPGRFLKEDPHTGLWVEIGDERAWKKAGQALRESAPEIRAERQAQLQMVAAGVVTAGMANPSGGGGVEGSTDGRKTRQADPPGPRHRPNPPEREGLSAIRGSLPVRNNDDYDANPRRGNNHRQQQQFQVEDQELARMRKEYLQMQMMQQEQQRRMQKYEDHLQKQQKRVGSGGNTSSNCARDVYDGYQQMLGTYRQQVHHTAVGQLATSREAQRQQKKMPGRGDQQHRYQNQQDIAAAIMDDGLLPVDAGFVIPALRGDHHHQQGQYIQQYQKQQQKNYHQDNYNESNGDNGNAVQAQEAFDRHFNSCDKTVSTMSSFDIQSMDMSSLGGFSWNQSGYNMSGLISTGSTIQSSGGYNNFNASSKSNNTSKGKNTSRGDKEKKSALERKLEKVNEAHRRQQVLEGQRKMRTQQHKQGQEMVPQAQMTQQQMMMQQVMMMQEDARPVMIPTVSGDMKQSQHHSSSSGHHHNCSGRKNTYNQDLSLTSFGFEAIEEDDITEASYKMSNLGLSEMDMTFSSDLLSFQSKSVPEMRVVGGGDECRKEGSDRKIKTSTVDKPLIQNGKRPHSQGDVDEDQVAQHCVDASSLFNQSLSSTSNTSSSLSKSVSSLTQKKFGATNLGIDDFNESFKSLEMEDRSKGGGAGNKQPQQRRHMPDPDGVVGGQRGNPPPSPRKDPSGVRLLSIQSSPGGGNGAKAASASNNGRQIADSMCLSDPDLMMSGGEHGGGGDFGASLESLRSQNSDGSSWLNQYNSMENIGSDRNPWDEEDRADASDGTSMSEISAPRMVTVTGGDAT